MKCPYCKLYMTRIVYGEHDRVVHQMQKLGLVILGGWEYYPEFPLYACDECGEAFPFVQEAS